MHLSLKEKTRILLDNVYGVDIDPQAVEVAQLSLYLKLLADETTASARQYTLKFHQPVLPSLADNIKCGNSLIGPDFYNGQQQSFLDEEEQYRVNVFDWSAKDGFHEIMKNGGFDAVIGNPPYVNIRILTQVQSESVKQYFERNYSCARRGYDLYVLFVEKGSQILKPHGLWGMIVPNKIGTLDYATRCRELLLREKTILNVVDASGIRVFSNASVYPYVIVWENSPAATDHAISVVHAKTPEDLLDDTSAARVHQAKLDAKTGFAIHGELDVENRVVTQPLQRRAKLDSGTTGFVAQQMAGSLVERSKRAASAFDFIVSGNIDRYEVTLGNVRFMKHLFTRPVLPKNSKILTKRKHALYSSRKIVIAGMTKRIEAAWDDLGLALGVQVFAASQLVDPPFFVLGLLNSKLLSYLFRLRFQAKHLAGGFLAINMGQLAKLPIRIVGSNEASARSKSDSIVKLVDRLLELQRQVPTAKTDHAKTVLQRQIDATDRQIDQLVYQLYGLTESEIALVESATM